jgi:WD40 repeat protein
MRLWDLDSGGRAGKAECAGKVGSVAAAVGGGGEGLLLAAGEGGEGSGAGTVTLYLRQASGGALERSAALDGHEGGTWSLAFAPPASVGLPALLASGGQDHLVKLWSVGSSGSASHCSTLAGHTNAVLSVAFTNDGRWLLSVGYDKKLRVWDPAAGTSVATVQLPSTGYCVATGDGPLTFVASRASNRVVAVDLRASGKVALELEGHTSPLRCVAVLDGGWGGGVTVASGGQDKTARVWDVRGGSGGACTSALQQAGTVESVAWAAPGTGDGGSCGPRLVTAGGFGGDVCLWQLGKGVSWE